MKKRIPIVLVAVIAVVLCALPITAHVVRAAYVEEVGDFYLIGAGSENYAWKQDKTDRVLYITGDGTVTVKNKDPNKATGWRIEIAKDHNVTLRLEGVNIDTKLGSNGSAITIGYNSTRDVRIEAVKDTVNRLTGWNGAGIQKNGDNANVGTLEIVGEGTLYATGAGEETYGQSGAGIGGFGSTAIKNICIDGPTVNATGGYYAAGIGAGGVNATAKYKYTDIFDIVTVSNIVIRSGTVIAEGGISGAGIGSGRSSAVDGITIEGGTVTARGG